MFDALYTLDAVGAYTLSQRLRAAWPSGLGKGLQSPVHGFDSHRRLSLPDLHSPRSGSLFGLTGTDRLRPTQTP